MLRTLAVAVALAAGAGATAQELKYAELGDLKLTSGSTLRDARLGYRTLGTLNPAKSNAILWPTWFTGKSEQLLENVGPGKFADSSKYFVILVDALANGVSSSPSNAAAEQARVSYPRITIRDMVNAEHQLVTRTLGLTHLHAVMGISMGGMQTFEWMVAYPDFMDYAVPIVGTPWQTSYDKLLWTTACNAIRLDPAFRNGNYDAPPAAGLGVMAGISHLALETPEVVTRNVPAEKFESQLKQWQDDSVRESDANNYIAQADAMLTHDVRRTFGGSMEQAAKAVKSRVLVVVDLRDHMVNPGPALEFARALKANTLELANDCGHLATACEDTRIAAAINKFLAGGGRKGK